MLEALLHWSVVCVCVWDLFTYLKSRVRSFLHWFLLLMAAKAATGLIQRKPAAWVCFWVSHMSAVVQVLRPSFATFPGYISRELDEKWSRWNSRLQSWNCFYPTPWMWDSPATRLLAGLFCILLSIQWINFSKWLIRKCEGKVWETGMGWYLVSAFEMFYIGIWFYG